MQYPERFSTLLGYPFPRLRALLDDIKPGGEPLRLSLGEPRHKFPKWVSSELVAAEESWGRYPKNNGQYEWIDAVTGYLHRRFGITAGAGNLTPLNGTREGLFMAGLALFPESKNGQKPVVLVPNPFYQVYMMAARTLGLDIEFVNCDAQNGYLADYSILPKSILDRTVAVFLCSPSNPQGRIADAGYIRGLIDLAEQHDFLIMADECYSEIYFETPPASVYRIAQDMGADLNRVVAFHSLSKRSNLPGLRSGFALSGEASMKRFQALRGYAGAPVPGPVQSLSAKLWDDDQHVQQNRAQYAEKMHDVREIFGADQVPDGGFFLWLKTGNGVEFARDLWRDTGIEVLPGEYLAADTPAGNPGHDYIRVALVEPKAQLKQAFIKIKEYIELRG